MQVQDNMAALQHSPSESKGLPSWIHVPTPGDHYSGATGSAIMTIIYEMNRVHAAQNEQSWILVSEGTMQDYEVGQCKVVRPTAPPQRWQKTIDVLLAKIGLPRFFTIASYRPHAAAVPAGFDGRIFLHNAIDLVPYFKKLNPNAKVYSWANNHLTRTHSTHELITIARSADGLLCCSNYVAQLIRDPLPDYLKLKVAVVLNGVDTRRFLPAVRPTPEIPLILFVGRVHATKGPDILIKAAVRLHESGINFKLRIVGSSNFNAADPLTPYELQLRELAQPLGDKIEFQTFVDRERILHEYQSADIFCAPSNWDEPFGLTIAEALSCGLPVVTSNRGGIPEVGKDAALYFSPPDDAELAEHLALLLSSLEYRQELAIKARSRALELDWQCRYRSLNNQIHHLANQLLGSKS